MIKKTIAKGEFLTFNNSRREEYNVSSPALSDQSSYCGEQVKNVRDGSYTPVKVQSFKLNIYNDQEKKHEKKSNRNNKSSNDSSPNSENDVDVFKFYKQKKEDDKQDKLLSMISELKNKVEKQEDTINKLKGNNKKTKMSNLSEYISSDKFSKSSDNSDKNEESNEESQEQEEKEDDVPDYENMSSDEKEHYTILFETNFQLLKKTYPSLILSIPKVREISLRSSHEIYCELVNLILIYLLAMKIKVFYIAGCALIEYVGNKMYGIAILKNITRIQLKRIDKYYSFFYECSKYIYSYMNSEYSPMMKFIINVGSSLISFFTVQGISLGLNFGQADDDLLAKVDKFVSPDDTKIKFRDNNIPDVPQPPKGDTHPDEILNKIPKLLDYALGPEKKEMNEEKPPEEKKRKDKYDMAF